MKNNLFKYNIALRIVKATNVVLMTIPFLLCWYLYYASRVVSPYYAKGNWLIIALFFALYIIFGRTYDAFLVSISRISEMIYSQALAAVFSDAILYLVIWLLTKRLPNILPLLGALVVQIAVATIWSVLSHKWYYATFPPRRSAIIYDDRKGLAKLIDEYGLSKKFHIEITLSADQCINHLEMLDDMDTVFLSGVHSHDRNVILKDCVAKNINVYVIPRIGDVIMDGAKKVHMFHLPILRVGRYSPPPEYLFLKRAFDIASSAIALIVLSPIMLITAIAIKASDGGPVLYKQVRLTQNGQAFNVFKFRSMRVDAEKDGVARLSTGDKDERITPVGRFIRKVRIDELPQLLNILAGTLSVVGPRPERPEIAWQYEEEMPEFALRLQAKAGLTGYAQVYGKYNTTPYDKLQMDLMYISHPSIIEDMKIIFATIKILFMPESTEGIAEGQITAVGANKKNKTDKSTIFSHYKVE